MILRVVLIDQSRIVRYMETTNAIQQEAWLEYELVQGILDAATEEERQLALDLALIEASFGGFDDDPCDGSQACYNALTNDPREWK